MNIQFSDTNFKSKYPTGRILEVTTRKIFEPDGVMGYIKTIKELHGNVPKYIGNKGYRHYAEAVSEKITEKYPEIKQASIDIIEIAEKNKYATPRELKSKISHILGRFDSEIDIII